MLIEISMFAISAILFGVAIYFYFFHSSRLGDSSQVNKNFFETTPARQLVPRFDPLISQGDHLIVTSASGSYLETEPGGSLWQTTLERWVESGIRLTYLVVGGQPGYCRGLASLALKYSDQIEIRFFDGAYVRDEVVTKTALDFVVTHPVALLNSSGLMKAFWLERFHYPESSVAMDVSYVSPNSVGSSDLVEEYAQKLWLVLENSDVASIDQLEAIASKKLVAA